MNWSVHIESVASHGNYIVLGTHYSSYALNVFYFDGDSAYVAGSVGGQSDGPYQVWLAGDYFIEKNKNNWRFWQKKATAAQLPTFERKTTPLVLNQPASTALAFPLVRTHASGFSVEWYDKGDSVGTRPLLQNGSDNYATTFFQTHQALANGYQDRTSQIVHSGKRLFNLSFSAGDNQVFGLQGLDAAGGACGLNESCNFQYYSTRTRPDNTSTFVDPNSDMSAILYGVGHFNSSNDLIKQTHLAMSNASRMIGVLALNKVTRKIDYQHFQWNGFNYNVSEGPFIVSKFQTSSGIGSLDKDNFSQYYSYQEPGNWAVEFNSNSLTPEFEFCKVSRKDSKGNLLGSFLSFFQMDLFNRPLYGKFGQMKGTLRKSAAMGGTDTIGTSEVFQNFVRDGAWPAPIWVTLPSKEVEKTFSGNRAYQTSRTTYHQFNLVVGKPAYIVTALGAGPHKVHQTIFDNANLPYQMLGYLAPTYPDTGGLKNVSPLIPLNTQGSYTGLAPFSGTRISRVNKYLVQKKEAWRDYDQNLSESGMKSGNTPALNINEGWLPVEEIVSWNAYKQVQEKKSVRSTVAGEETFSALYYEGRRSDPIGVVGNSKRVNSSILMAENGNAGLTKLDYDGRWTGVGTSYSSSMSHSGRYSFKVTDNYGPTATFAPVDVVRDKLGFRVSAWIYTTSGGSVSFTVERRNASTNTQVEVLNAYPVDGSVQSNQWRRWEANLSYAQLTAGGLFTSASGQLVVRVGTGAPTGDGNRVIYVDDIVCIPSNASFSMTTFDENGRKTSSTPGSHVTSLFEYGIRGELMGVRDENFGIHAQQGFHGMGEN